MIIDNILLEPNTSNLPQYLSAEKLEMYLGSPFIAENAFSYENAAALDEAEIFPKECIDTLHDWGFHHYYIPESIGGKLRSFDELLLLTRVVSRRDLSHTHFWDQFLSGLVEQNNKKKIKPMQF